MFHSWSELHGWLSQPFLSSSYYTLGTSFYPLSTPRLLIRHCASVDCKNNGGLDKMISLCSTVTWWLVFWYFFSKYTFKLAEWPDWFPQIMVWLFIARQRCVGWIKVIPSDLIGKVSSVCLSLCACLGQLPAFTTCYKLLERFIRWKHHKKFGF